MLTANQLETFFHEILLYPDWKRDKENNVPLFLRELVQRYQWSSYFHNMVMASTPQDDRRPPVETDAVRIGLAGTGGVCIHQNYFITLILQSLGFDAFISAGMVVDTPEDEGEGNHCMCILQIGDTETYAIEVGVALPLDEPIPLHNLPYFGKAGGMRFEYRYNEKANQYERWQHDGSFLNGKFDDPTKTTLRYRFTTNPKDFSYFTHSLQDIFTNPEKSIFLKFPFLFRSLDLEKGAGVEGRRFILVFGAEAVIYDRENQENFKFSDFKEMQPFIEKYFPKLGSSQIAKALASLNECKAKVDLENR